MGNVAVSEALKLSVELNENQKIIDRYIASQAASTADAYNATAPERTPENSTYYYRTGFKNWFNSNLEIESSYLHNGSSVGTPSPWFETVDSRRDLAHGEIPDYYTYSDFDPTDHELIAERTNRELTSYFKNIPNYHDY